ncbi:hypothetical protein BS78_05G049800, partial [Paspalum vaginatum]
RASRSIVTSADDALQEFLVGVQSTTSSLLPTPVATPIAPCLARHPSLPLRSRRIAAQRLAGVPISKRGELILMRRLGILMDDAPVTSEAVAACDNLYRWGLTPEHVCAIRELFPAAAAPSSGGVVPADEATPEVVA